MQILDIKPSPKNAKKFSCTVRDEEDSLPAYPTTDVAALIAAQELVNGSIISMTDYACNKVDDKYRLIITGNFYTLRAIQTQSFT